MLGLKFLFNFVLKNPFYRSHDFKYLEMNCIVKSQNIQNWNINVKIKLFVFAFWVISIASMPIAATHQIKAIAHATLSIPIPAVVTIENSPATKASLPQDENIAQKSYVQQRLIAHQQAHSMQLKEIIYHFFGKILAQNISKGEFALGSSFELDGIMFRRFAHGLGDETVLVSISIPYFESVEKQKPTNKESAKFAIMATIAHLMQIKNEMYGSKDQYKEIDSFLEAAENLHLVSPMLCEKSYTGIGNGENFARCRRIAQSRWLGLGETQYRVECLIYLPLATLEVYNKS
jgi:hypothetical protein